MKNSQVSPRISIAIVTHNRSAEVLRAIQSVYQQSYGNFEIVVADNASTDATAAAIAEKFPEVTVIQLHRNFGACGGRNVALANCRGEIIFNMDDDATLQSDTLETVMAFFATAAAGIDLVACQIFEHEVYRFPKQSSFTGIFEGCGWAIRRETLQRVGYFSDHLFRAAEENDFSLTYLAAGYRMWYLSEAIIHHMPSQVRNSKHISFYKCRNELLIIFERYPWLLILPFATRLILSQLLFGLRSPAYLVHILWGILIGLGSAPKCFLKRRSISFSVLRKVTFSPLYKSRLKFLAGSS